VLKLGPTLVRRCMRPSQAFGYALVSAAVILLLATVSHAQGIPGARPNTPPPQGWQPRTFRAPFGSLRRSSSGLRTSVPPPGGAARIHPLAGWAHGRWRHARYHGSLGWWWVVGSVWYLYPEATNGPPAYVSETEVPEQVIELANPDTPSVPVVPIRGPKAVYYAPGDLKGVPYDTANDCAEAQRRAANEGICVVK
jgi:hypothetical protein